MNTNINTPKVLKFPSLGVDGLIKICVPGTSIAKAEQSIEYVSPAVTIINGNY